jgi:hypothetical protein
MVFASELDSVPGITKAVRHTVPIWQLEAMFGARAPPDLVSTAVDKIRTNANRLTGRVDPAPLPGDPFTATQRQYLAHIRVDGTHSPTAATPATGLAALPHHVLQIIKTHFVASKLDALAQWRLVCRAFATTPRADMRAVVPLSTLPFIPESRAEVPPRAQAHALFWLADRFNFFAAGVRVPWVHASSVGAIVLYTAVTMNMLIKPVVVGGARAVVAIDSDGPVYYVRRGSAVVSVTPRDPPALNPAFRHLVIENKWSAGAVVSALAALGLSDDLALDTLVSPYGAADFLTTSPQRALTKLVLHRHAAVPEGVLEANAGTLTDLAGPFMLTGVYPRLARARLLLNGDNDQPLGSDVQIPALELLDVVGAQNCPSLVNVPAANRITRLRWAAPEVMCQAPHRYATADDRKGLERLTSLRHLVAVGVLQTIPAKMAEAIAKLPLRSLCIKLAVRSRPTNKHAESWPANRLLTMLSDPIRCGTAVEARAHRSTARWRMTTRPALVAAMDVAEQMDTALERTTINGEKVTLTKRPGGLVTCTHLDPSMGTQTVELRREPLLTLEMTGRCMSGILDDLERVRHLFRQLVILPTNDPQRALRERIVQHYRRTLAPMVIHG